MLTKKMFAFGMEYLKAYYPNFKMEMENIFAQQIWYENLSHIDDASFEILIKKYSRGNEYPPQSPTHLLNWFDDMLNDRAIEINTEFRILERDTMIYGRYSNDPLMDPNTAYINYKAIYEQTKNPVIKNLVTALQNKEIKEINKDVIKDYITKSNQQLTIGTSR